MIFELRTANEIRENISRKQQKKLYKLYLEVYNNIVKDLKKMKGETAGIQEISLRVLQRDLRQYIQDIHTEMEKEIINNMTDVSRKVVEDTRDFLKKLGFHDVEGAFSYVPREITNRIVNGQIYAGNWSLSQTIWGHTNNFNDKLSYIVAKGTAQGKSAYDIAKDLEKYVNPAVAKKSRVIEFEVNGKKEKFYFGNVDYNAQRLARTMVSHAYQQTFQLVNEKDPFVKDYVWISSLQHGRTCSLCFERHGKHFKKDELPLDHPNGMCTFEAYIPHSMNEISDKIAKWYSSPAGTFPELDEYAKTF